jgi:hypothetical protein
MKLYYHRSIPNAIIVELEDGTRLRHDGLEIKAIDLSACKPYLPPKAYDAALFPVPDYIARFYLPEDEQKRVKLRINITPSEKAGLEHRAEEGGQTVSRYIRDRIF